MVFWNIMLIFMTVWTGFAVPFQASFRPVAWMTQLDILCDVVFIVDVCINFRTAYYKSIGTLELQSLKIMRRYLRTWFVIDLIGSVPLDWFVPNSDEHVNLMVMLRLCKFVRFGRLIKLVEYLKFSSLGGILQLYLVILMVCHWLACM
jgi:hyperpolarization activated cyclic nucleotide-gated potassium channel 3